MLKSVKYWLKYWLKLISMPEDSLGLLKACYLLEYRKSMFGVQNWASQIKDLLDKYSFSWIWQAQSVEDHYAFLKWFEERVIDCELHKWSAKVMEISKLRTYCLHKEVRHEEHYLTVDMPRRVIVSLARFRTGSHNLEIECGRHKMIPLVDRICAFCLEKQKIRIIKDEFHVLLECCAYHELRNWYIKKHYSVASMYSFISLMNSNNNECIVNVANFLASVFKLRKRIAVV